MRNLKEISFGFTSAQTERSEDPGLLIDGYIDLSQVTEQARDGSKFLFLGYKGSGKSAIGERLELTSESAYNQFVRLVPLSDFPFNPFSKIVRGDVEPDKKFPIAWSWVLLPYLLESFSRDNGVHHHNLRAFQEAVEAFRKMGLCPTEDPAKIVRTSSKANFKIVVPHVGEAGLTGSELKPASEIPDFVDSLKELISGIRSDSRHYLIIDGLDDILTGNDL